jgi:hypothetical protein
LKVILGKLAEISAFFILAFCISYCQNKLDDIENQDIHQGFDNALKELDKSTLNMQTDGQSLTILPVNVFLDEQAIDRLLKPAHGKSHPLIYSYSDEGVYTMSAQSTHQAHYLVNAYLEGYAPFEVDNVMMPLYALSQRKSYLLDNTQYQGRADVWQSSRQAFLYPRGDCEDHAIALADWLIEMGEDARVALGDVDGGGHAWVILFKDGKQYLLEATQKRGLARNKPYPIAALHTDYHPEFMFNRHDFWVNTGSKYTTDYASENWQRMSRYHIMSSSIHH